MHNTKQALRKTLSIIEKHNYLCHNAAKGENKMLDLENDTVRIQLFGEEDKFWTYTTKSSGSWHEIGSPRFEIGDKIQASLLLNIQKVCEPRRLANGVVEHRFRGHFASDPDLSLEMVFHIADNDPVIRFRYILRSEGRRRLTKRSGKDELTYLGVSLANFPVVKEVRLSEFNEMVHSYCLSERQIDPPHFENELHLMGPILVGHRDGCSIGVAYEHGSQVPDAFIEFLLAPDRKVRLKAVKGNYCEGQIVDHDHPYETIWLEFIAVNGGEDSLSKAFRAFVLGHICPNRESRKPYIFYNTWAYQERNKWWNGKSYLDSMNQERIMQEIEVAHRMGVEVFVLDTGWYEKTGDWCASRKRFPNGLKPIKEKLDDYGMKLGLWLNPAAAAISSQIFRNHRDCVVSQGGRTDAPQPIWETEESHRMCLVSRYGDALVEKLISLVEELGVTYLKWDGIGQYGCDDAGHRHGDARNRARERADCHAFEIPQVMAYIAEQLAKACPDVIVDFDVTEAGRCVGLCFLSAGRYFLVNNGPYYSNYDVPIENTWSNIFVRPGPARGRICRKPLGFDRWIPSVCFLTHYLPDDPKRSQILNIASLILGQNGIWGDLLSISEQGVQRFAHLLGLYKQVRDDVAASFPVRSGEVGGDPEIHEKINEATGRGAVVLFSNASGKYTYVTANRVVPEYWHTEGVSISFDRGHQATIRVVADGLAASIVFFGVRPHQASSF